MRVFVTGASGWIGSAVVPRLVGAGHQVVGLARSDSAADAIAAAGGEVLRGSLDDLDRLGEGAAGSDGVIHLAFIHDFTQYEEANHADRRAIEAMGAALEASDRPLVVASGLLTTADGSAATEEDAAPPDFPRTAASTMTMQLAERGVRSSVVRLPPTVHGRGDRGFLRMIADMARQKEVSGYIGDGSNVWPAVHRLDAAEAFVLALEQAPAGSVWHAVADEGVPTRTIAEAIGTQLDIPVEPVAPDDAAAHFGWMGLVWGAHLPASSVLTRARLGWRPTGPSLLEDLEAGHYFEPIAQDEVGRA